MCPRQRSGSLPRNRCSRRRPRRRAQRCSLPPYPGRRGSTWSRCRRQRWADCLAAGPRVATSSTCAALLVTAARGEACEHVVHVPSATLGQTASLPVLASPSSSTWAAAHVTAVHLEASSPLCMSRRQRWGSLPHIRCSMDRYGALLRAAVEDKVGPCGGANDRRRALVAAAVRRPNAACDVGNSPAGPRPLTS